MKRLIVLPLICALICLVTKPASAENESKYKVLPVGLIVAPATRTPEGIVARRSGRKLEYDEYFRAPNQNGNAEVIHCSKTRWIGGVYLVQRSVPRPTKHQSDVIRHIWTHEYVNEKHRDLDHIHPIRMASFETETVLVEYLELNKRYKVEGTWTLRSYIDDVLLSEQVFRLVDCKGEDDQSMIRDFQSTPGSDRPD